ncbi:unnamed protein product [Moneuplotes crassus]|uniref:MULE transposase domain-containing protein n=1 Tax=Euplotes crassus TaxID=5936 RepID=A0AAD2DB09_EUPCR|nr:unnamed protein product [Moneuplotes crassus]
MQSEEAQLKVQKMVAKQQETIINNLINNLADMAGIKAPIFTKSFMVKVKYLNKGRMLASNPNNYYELCTSVYKCFPEIYNIDDCYIYFNDWESDRAAVKEDDDVQAAYKLMNLKKGNILTFYVENRKQRKVIEGDLDADKIAKIKLDMKLKNPDSFENAMLVRSGYVYEFVSHAKKAYSFRCDDFRRGCKGKWYMHEADLEGLGIEHSAHSLLKEEHKALEVSSEIAKTALSIVPFLDMKGELPYKVSYSTFKKVISKLLEQDFRLTRDDLVNCFVSLGTDWNLLSKRILDNLISKIKARLSVRTSGGCDCTQLRTVEGAPFCRNIIEAKVEDMKQFLIFFYSTFHEMIAKESKTLYISGSYAKYVTPDWSETIFVKAFKNGCCIPVCTFMTQSSSEDAFKAGFQFLKEEMQLSPNEIVIDPNADLTRAAISVFGNETKYQTCSYFVHKHINQKAIRSGVLNDKGDQNIRKLLWCLKALAFRPKEEVLTYFSKVQGFYKRFCEAYDKTAKMFEELFLKKLNVEYWNMNHLLSEPNDKRQRYLEMNRRLEIHDVLVERFLKGCAGINGFNKGLAEIERKARFMIERNELANIQVEDLDEATILKDLIHSRFKIEQVMSHAFQIPSKDRAIDLAYNPSMSNLKSITDRVPSTTFSMEPAVSMFSVQNNSSEPNSSDVSMTNVEAPKDIMNIEEGKIDDSQTQGTQKENFVNQFDTQFNDTLVGDGFLPVEQTPATPYTPHTLTGATQRPSQGDGVRKVI